MYRSVRVAKKGVGYLGYIVVVLVGVLIFVYPKLIFEGASSGFELALSNIIPSLLPIMIVASVLNGTRARRIVGYGIDGVGRGLFRVCGNMGSTILLSLVGGYPIAAKLLSEDVERGYISAKKAGIMLCYLTSPGVGFLITAIGYKMLGNVKIGVLLFLCNIVVNVVMGVILERVLGVKEEALRRKSDNNGELGGFCTELSKSIVSSSKMMVIITGYMVFFGSIISLINGIARDMFGSEGLFTAVLEVGYGSSAVVRAKPIDMVAMLGFVTFICGVCIIFQIKMIVEKSGIGLKLFVIMRLIGGIGCYLLARLAVGLFPQILETGSISQAHTEIFAYNPYFSLLLVIMCVVFLIDIAT